MVDGPANSELQGDARPEVVVLAPEAGLPASATAPVRIFLGTEDAQHRAERVFIWSIEKVRDPTRRYEIYLMKNLPGFRTTGWRTGFTNYRFAIPDFADRHGRAIYNDVDQIYLTDPAQLFDTPLDGRGYLSISPEETSVMLLDCAVMSEWWNFSAAATQSKDELLAAAQLQEGLWGQLDPGWNARDLEYRRGQSHLLHFTALHTQPWQPTPRQYSYHPHPHGELWFGLEREADAAGFGVCDPQRASKTFAGTAASSARKPPREPRVWVLLGVKAGDNAQLRNLAGAIGWPFEEKQLAFNAMRRLPNVVLGPSRLSLTAGVDRILGPPWPDLILSAGKRSAPVALWIAQQARKHCRLVHLGRPRLPLRDFDLVVTTPQYGLPARPNVIHNLLPLNRPSPKRLAEAATAWAPRFASLERPLIAVLVGGNSVPYVFDETSAERLADEANEVARVTGGSLLVSSSPRTPDQAFEALCARLSAPAHVHRWSATGDNPYLAYLALADSFIVTADSASLVAEACSTGKPVALFAQSDLDVAARPSHRRQTARGTPKQQKAADRVRDWFVVNGWRVPPRNLPALHQLLLLHGLITATGSNCAPAAPQPLAPELELAAERVRKLFDDERSV